MQNILHESLGCGNIDLQAENDRLRELYEESKQQLNEARMIIAYYNNNLWEYMGWDLKHGPTIEEYDNLPRNVRRYIDSQADEAYCPIECREVK